MNYLVDSSAWISYLNGDISGERLNKILKSQEEVFVIAPIISEVISFIVKNKGNSELAYETISKNSKLIDISLKSAKNAGILHGKAKIEKKNLPIIDAIIISVAQEFNLTVLTKDNHFKSFKESIII